MTETNKSSLRVESLHKSFQIGDQTIDVLKGVSLAMQGGDSAVVVGPSGSGKSTFLHIIGTLDQPDAGSVAINGKNPFELAEPELAKFRNDVIGFIFQDHHLLPQYNVLENVLIPILAFHRDAAPFEQRARHLLERVGLSHRLSHKPAALSGGERQRVAIARALINKPHLLLCDEPTGNLDHASAAEVAALLFELHRDEQNILVVVTHSLELADHFAQKLTLSDGVFVTK